MLQIVKVTKNSRDPDAVKALYESAFPKKERIDFRFLLENAEEQRDGNEILALYDGELFVGFVILLTAGDISQIGYFAVEESLRSKGYGSRILQTVQNSKPGQRFTADVEKPDRTCDNYEQRERRLRFYGRNGYQKTGIAYRWCGEEYLLLSYNGAVSKEEYAEYRKQRADFLRRAENYR